MFFLLACGSVVNVEQSFIEFQQGLRDYVSCFIYVVYTKLMVDVLMKVIKHTIIHGYQFNDALEHALN